MLSKRLFHSCRSLYRPFFTELPNELKLNIISQSNIPNNVSKEVNRLNEYVNSKKIKHYLKDSYSISFFCPSSRTCNKKLIYSIKPKFDLDKSIFEIDKLLKEQEIIPIKFYRDCDQKEDFANHLELLIDEEQNFLKLYVQFKKNDLVLKESNFYLNLNDKELKTDNVHYNFEIIKGDLEKRGLYDFSNLINYSFNLKNFNIENFELIKCIENKQGELIVDC